MKTVSKSITKVCSQCRIKKNRETDFYHNKGVVRGECKKCTIKKNVIHQRQSEAWKNRCIDPEDRRLYMREYYAKNKEKFAQYRSKFKNKNPEYYKNYSRDHKNESKNDR